MSKTRKTAGKTAKSSDYGTAAEIVPYRLDGGKSIPVKLDRETVWLTPDQMAVLFDCSRQNAQKHIKAVLADGELDNSTCNFYLQVAANGKTYRRAYYNLEMIISVGFRVNSKRGIVFRRWANGVLCERLTGRPAAPAPAVHAPAPARPSLPWNPNISDAQNYAARYFEMESLVDRLRRDLEQGLAMLEKRVESHENALNIILKVNDFDRDLLKTFARYNWELKRNYRNSRDER